VPADPLPHGPDGPEWTHEIKHDGFRLLARKDGEKVRLWSRQGRSWTREFAAITAALRALAVSQNVLDGEAVAHCDQGLPDFLRLLSGDGHARACLFAFDLLMLGGDDLRPLPLAIRRNMLAELCSSGQRPHGGPGRRGHVPARLRHGAGGHHLEALGQALPIRPLVASDNAHRVAPKSGAPRAAGPVPDAAGSRYA